MFANSIEQETGELTIKQMAQQTGLSEHTLRYYERIGLIKPIPRDLSSGHRRYPSETVATVESLSCLRETGMPIGEMRRYLVLCEQGRAAASEQITTFIALEAKIACDMEVLKRRQDYLAGKVAFWRAVEAGDDKKAMEIGSQNRLIARGLAHMKETI